MKFFALSILATFTIQAFAGSAQSEIKCASASGKTLINATLPGDSTEAAVVVILDATSTHPTMSTAINPDMEDFLAFNGRVPEREYPGYKILKIETRDHLPTSFGFSIFSAESGDKTVNLSAFRNSIKVKNTNYGHRATFKAELTMNDPRPDHPNQLKGVIVNCSLVQEI